MTETQAFGEDLLQRHLNNIAGLAAKLPAVFLLGFFTAHIRNRNTRRVSYKAACRFADRCEGRSCHCLAHVKPPQVGAYVEGLAVTKPEGPGSPSQP